MYLWHLTPDTPRTPDRVSADEGVTLAIGTWPVEPAQEVWVTTRAERVDGTTTETRSPAVWQHNEGANSYWRAELGPFADGDRIRYTIHGRSPAGEVDGPVGAFDIEPKIHLALLWHQHQPLYRDLAAPRSSGSHVLPWVRLHAIRDYYSMAALVAEHPGVHLTINLTPVLLWQIEDYTGRGATDRALDLIRVPAESLTAEQRTEMLATFFGANRDNQIAPQPRYAELLAQHQRGASLDTQDLRDLQMWFNLAWFGKEFRAADVELATGDVVSVRRFVEQQRGFTPGDIDAMLADENAWGAYREDARPFLHALYGLLERDTEVRTVTFSEYLDGNPTRRVRSHPMHEHGQVHELSTGSWIDEMGSAPGPDLGTWIGEPEENRAWELLGRARAELAHAGATPETAPSAFFALYAAEGSDWFWWYGKDQESGADEQFDALFRGHLAAVYTALGVPRPPDLAHPIIRRNAAVAATG